MAHFSLIISLAQCLFHSPQFPWHHPTPSPTIASLAHTNDPDWTEAQLFPRAGPRQMTTATTQALSPSAEANSQEGTASTGHADPLTTSITQPQVHNTHPSSLGRAIPLPHLRSSHSNPTSIRPRDLLLVPRVLGPHLRQRARVAPVMIAECTPTTNCARVLPVAGVVEVVVEADKAIFSLLLWTGTNVQAVGDQTLAERDWTGLSMDQVRMHLIQVRIPPLGH